MPRDLDADMGQWMNSVEIEETESALAERPFEGGEFPCAFLEPFGNKATTVERLRSGASNNSDLDGVRQRSNIRITVCPKGEAAATLAAFKLKFPLKKGARFCSICHDISYAYGWIGVQSMH